MSPQQLVDKLLHEELSPAEAAAQDELDQEIAAVLEQMDKLEGITTNEIDYPELLALEEYGF